MARALTLHASTRLPLVRRGFESRILRLIASLRRPGSLCKTSKSVLRCARSLSRPVRKAHHWAVILAQASGTHTLLSRPERSCRHSEVTNIIAGLLGYVMPSVRRTSMANVSSDTPSHLLLAFLQSQSQTTLTRLYQRPSSCLSIFRSISYFIMLPPTG